MANNKLLIRKFPLGFIEIELKKIDSNALNSLKDSEDKIIKMRELDKKLSEFFYTTKFFNLMSKTEGYEDPLTVESLIPFQHLPEKWIKMTEGYMKCIKREHKDDVGKIMIYEFRRIERR